MKRFGLLFLVLCTVSSIFGQGEFNPSENKFKQLGNELATPTVYRTASGTPGHMYWQQRADYLITIELDDATQQIHGEEVITYINNSPDRLSYLWIQLDQNLREKDGLAAKSSPSIMREKVSPNLMSRLSSDFDAGFKIGEVVDMKGKPISYTVNYTMMRLDLKAPLKSGEQIQFKISWWYNINDRMKDGGGRSGMEYFEKDDNYIYTIAQFFPRMAVYNETEGWQNKQFTGRSEFALAFGNYDVKIKVPADHKVAATGVLVNKEEVLSSNELERLEKAQQSFDKPIVIVTEDEARSAMKSKAKQRVTWHFRAENVRDFAFASSRRFIWDAMAVKFPKNTAMAMSMYPPEGNPLWEKYSTRVVGHTLKVYSKHTFDYPYPVAWSIHTAQIGMEYPMICFNGGRPEEDGTYSERTKWGMIGVIIHEVGHNYFPMIVNSDERQWTWMDEGLNTFLQGLAEREWDHNHPRPSGVPANITSYMSGDKSKIAPIMINGDLTMQFNSNAYAKPATGLNILRETIMGRELFDFAFKQYAQQWQFKHPTPADLFRIMEDASAVDLDWFWRGWFYTTDHVDIALESVKVYTEKTESPSDEKALKLAESELKLEELTVQRNRKEFQSMVERDVTMQDFYDTYDENAVSDKNRKSKSSNNKLNSKEKTSLKANKYFVEVKCKNVGGMIMPLIFKFGFSDGSAEIKRVPAEIWSRDNIQTSKVFIFDKEVLSVQLDPNLETADCDVSNNFWPERVVPSRFEMYKHGGKRGGSSNPMQQNN